VLERLGLPATFFLVPRFLSGQLQAWWETLAWAVDSSPLRTLEWEDTSYSLEDSNARRRTYALISRRVKMHDDARRSSAVRALVERLEPAGDPPDLFMDWEGARELVARGFDVQAHTCTHPVLSHESDARQRSELADSRRELEDELGVAISIIAYPHGGPDDYDQRTTAIARGAGYSWGVTTREGFALDTAVPLEIPRCVVYPERGRIDLIAQLRYIATLMVKRGAR
jgi:peptidoglycan/xylan/chitin deacetylase (PgdA/CDA1 family)